MNTMAQERVVARVSRDQVEEFLIEETNLLDERRFDEWFALFEEGATYAVPQAGADGTARPETTLFYIADDYFRLGERVARMSRPDHHSEFPASICSRMISNVRIVRQDGDVVEAACKYMTSRSKNVSTDIFCGHHRYVLKVRDGTFSILAKTTYIDMNDLRPQGRVSIII